MEEFNKLYELFEQYRVLSALKAVALFAIGYFLAHTATITVSKLTTKNFTAHGQTILRRVIFYSIFVLFCVSALRELGFDLGVLLGAAGILTVAIGFASQTSASNLISGLFLMLERPFSIADVIRVGNTTGEVVSIDLLSVKLRTFDNLFVRIPNETMIKTEVTNLTKYPIRRMDLKLGVAYKEDIARVKEILTDIAEKNPLCMEEPAPLFIFLGFGNSSIDLQFSIWVQREHFLNTKNAVLEEIKQRFDAENIEIPFPHVSLYRGAKSEAFPVTIVNPASDKNL